MRCEPRRRGGAAAEARRLRAGAETGAVVSVEAAREPDAEADGETGRAVEVQPADGAELPVARGLPAVLDLPVRGLGPAVPTGVVHADHAVEDRADEEGGADAPES